MSFVSIRSIRCDRSDTAVHSQITMTMSRRSRNHMGPPDSSRTRDVLARAFDRQLAKASQIHLAGTERGDFRNLNQMLAFGQPQPRQIRQTELLPNSAGIDTRARVERDQPLASR